MDVYLRAKFYVSSIILTSFRQDGGGEGVGEGNFTPLPLTSKRTPKKPTQIRVKNNIRKNSKSGLNLDNKTTLHKFLQNFLGSNIYCIHVIFLVFGC